MARDALMAGTRPKTSPGEKGDSQRKEQDIEVERNACAVFADARDVARIDAEQQADSRKSQSKPDQAAGERERQAFDKKLADDLAAAGAESGARGEFAFARGGSARAGDWPRWRRRSGAQRRPLPREREAESRCRRSSTSCSGDDAESASARKWVVAIEPAELVCDQTQLGVGLGNGHARLEPCSHREEMHHVLRIQIELERHPKIGRRIGIQMPGPMTPTTRYGWPSS